MNLGICLQYYIPLRAEASEKSEMVSQLIYGETAEIIETNIKTGFSRVKMLFDNYEGWLDTKTLTLLDEKTYQRMNSLDEFICSDINNMIELNNRLFMNVGAGSSLWRKENVVIYPENVLSMDIIHSDLPESSREKIKQSALLWLNIPYIWGGRSSCGTDCSGFTQNIFKQIGVKLPRDSKDQAKIGKNIDFNSNAHTGDLAFFDNPEGDITHVGILLGSGKIIHSSGYIKIDKIDHNGIFSEENAKYTHKLRLIKNILDA